MGQKVAKVDFDWTVTPDPHRTRRSNILKVHPEIKKLMTYDPSLKFKVVALVLCQVVSAVVVSHRSWWLIFAAAYLWGGVWNHSLALAIHELSHNLAFGSNRPIANRILGIIANLPIGVPFSVAFRKYHLDHHRYQGVEQLDVDLPTEMEARIFKTKLTKLVWIALQPLFYAGRPLLVNPKPLEKMEVLNVLVQITFDYSVYQLLGPRALMYLISGTFLVMGLHPMSGHFISEHFVFEPDQETYSYYGPLNILTFNVGYHNEHHDFPNIPGKFLPTVKKMAPEFYDNLRHYKSWTGVLWRFLTDDAIDLKSRVRRAKVFNTPRKSQHFAPMNS